MAEPNPIFAAGATRTDSAQIDHYAAAPRVAAPGCSVCVANYNGAALLDDCLQSIFAQHGDVAIEVIVHDDASSDDSVALLRARYPQVEVIASRSNVGFCVGNNRMVQHARGEYILLLNNDAALFPDAIACMLDAARTQQPVGILTLPQYDWETGALVDRGCLLDPFYNPVPNIDPLRRDVAMAIGACLFVPRSLWLDLGGFPEWMDSIAEDLYLCCLARLRNLPVQVETRSGYRHRIGASFGGARVAQKKLRSTFRRRRLSERNKTFALIICTPSVAAWALLAVHLALLMLEGIVFSLVRIDWRIFTYIYFNVVRALWSDFGRLRTIRRSVQEKRIATARKYFAAFTWVPRKLVMLKRFGMPSVSDQPRDV